MQNVGDNQKYLELFLRNLILDEKKELHNRTMHISGTFNQELDIENAKLDIQDAKLDIENAKLDIRNQLLAFSNTVSEKTINHAMGLFLQYGKDVCFGRTNVEQITGLKSSAASNLIKLLKDSKLIIPVAGQGKGKYRFR